ncbi:MAG: zf-HC2 domain-containing protein, partial [Acidobacteria bacterium]|nr:zf-HC2 domain-containing protein [Acidobacteriota bacterium]
MKSRNQNEIRNECKATQALSSEYIDRTCTEANAREIARHLSACPACTDELDEMVHLRRTVHTLPRRAVPVNLAISLRVAASKQYAQRAARLRWKDRLYLWNTNIWRPMALPMCGGLATAFVLFAVLLPTLAPPVLANDDPPPSWYQSAEFSDMGPFGLRTDHVTLDLILDDQGRMVDYSIPDSETVLLHDQKL